MPEALLCIYKQLKTYSNKAPMPDNTAYKRKRTSLNQMTYSKPALETSSTMRRSLRQKSGNDATLDKCISLPAFRILSDRLDTVEKQNQEILSRLSTSNK